MTVVYVVMGTTGEWSDRRNWPVKAYTEERRAQEHVIRASERAREIHVRNSDPDDDFLFTWDQDEEPNEYDPDMQLDYTGTHYFIYEVELG